MRLARFLALRWSILAEISTASFFVPLTFLPLATARAHIIFVFYLYHMFISFCAFSAIAHDAALYYYFFPLVYHIILFRVCFFVSFLYITLCARVSEFNLDSRATEYV